MKSVPPTCSSFPLSNTRASRRPRRTSGITTRCPGTANPQARPGHPNSIVTDWSVDPDDWGYFLCKMFDEWRRNDVGKVLVNHFETLVSQHLGMGSQICIYGEFCGKGVAVETRRRRLFLRPLRLSGISPRQPRGHRLDAQVFSRTQVKFGYAKNETLPAYCRQCAYLTDCWGECPKNRIIRTADGEPGLNYLCRGLKTILRACHARSGAHHGPTCGSSRFSPEDACEPCFFRRLPPNKNKSSPRIMKPNTAPIVALAGTLLLGLRGLRLSDCRARA